MLSPAHSPDLTTHSLQISELATLIPEIMLDPNAGTPSLGQALFAISSQGSAVAEEGSPGADGA